MLPPAQRRPCCTHPLFRQLQTEAKERQSKFVSLQRGFKVNEDKLREQVSAAQSVRVALSSEFVESVYWHCPVRLSYMPAAQVRFEPAAISLVSALFLTSLQSTHRHRHAVHAKQWGRKVHELQPHSSMPTTVFSQACWQTLVHPRTHACRQMQGMRTRYCRARVAASRGRALADLDHASMHACLQADAGQARYEVAAAQDRVQAAEASAAAAAQELATLIEALWYVLPSHPWRQCEASVPPHCQKCQCPFLPSGTHLKPQPLLQMQGEKRVGDGNLGLCFVLHSGLCHISSLGSCNSAYRICKEGLQMPMLLMRLRSCRCAS
eukprot:scaffold205895_cov21-Tisochrysis_lutea.AAC.1